MADYKLANAAKDDLQRIYFYGLTNWGETAADRYYHAFFDRFEEIAKRPFLYPAVDFIRTGYRRSRAASIAFITASKMTLWRLWRFLEARIRTPRCNALRIAVPNGKTRRVGFSKFIF